MRVSLLVLLLLAPLIAPASTARYEVHVQVLSSLSQTVRGVGVGPAVGGQFNTLIPCSQPYPTDTIGVVPGNPASTDRCILAMPSREATGTVQNRRVEAILTTEDGQTYYVVLACQKQYGWCAPLAERANYVGRLNDQPKWLADYQHRPVYGFMKMSLRPSGKNRVTYLIEYAAKVEMLKR
jgi:hypothetical protein